MCWAHPQQRSPGSVGSDRNTKTGPDSPCLLAFHVKHHSKDAMLRELASSRASRRSCTALQTQLAASAISIQYPDRSGKSGAINECPTTAQYANGVCPKSQTDARSRSLDNRPCLRKLRGRTPGSLRRYSLVQKRNRCTNTRISRLMHSDGAPIATAEAHAPQRREMPRRPSWALRRPG